MSVNIVEVFSSIQGEGKYVGYRQVFVRLVGCNLKCDFCDTPDSRNTVASGRIELTAGKRDFLEINNPISSASLINHINNLLVVPHHSVSFTGGEPLCQVQAIIDIASKIKGKIFLETNGTLPEKLKMVLPYIDIISMDIKLPSTTGMSLWQEHHDFLTIANEREVFVKIVLTAKTTMDEFKTAIDLIANINHAIPLILQPVTPINNCHGISADQVLTLQEYALSKLSDVRVIPQTHKFIGQM